MKKDFIRTCSLTLALVLGAAMTMPSMAQPAASTRTGSFMITSEGAKSTPRYVALAEEEDCSQLNHSNFCYCTGACNHTD